MKNIMDYDNKMLKIKIFWVCSKNINKFKKVQAIHWS